MKFLSANRLTVVTLQDRQGANLFVVPAELAALLTWFLGSSLLRLIALMAWCLVRRQVAQCRAIYLYLTAIPGRIREAILDFFLGGLVYAT